MANDLGHEVDLDRNEYKYLASEDSVSSAAKSAEPRCRWSGGRTCG